MIDYVINNKVVQNSFLLQFIMQKKWKVLRHALLLFITAVNFHLLNFPLITDYATKMEASFGSMFLWKAIVTAYALFIIYINIYLLYPKYIQTGKYLHYAGYVLLLFASFLLLQSLAAQILSLDFDKYYKDGGSNNFFDIIESFIYPVTFLLTTTGYQLFKSFIVHQQRLSSLEKEKLSTELTQLKNQVNPHFLFNTLNNLHVLATKDPEKAAKIILGLSDVLRYQIYDSGQDIILLQKDIAMLRQLTEIEKIRRRDLTVTFEADDNVNTITLPPLLFINFVENAIKHSNVRGAAVIHIIFSLRGKMLYFEITNSKSPVKVQNENSGLGLANSKKRLDLLYGDTYTLNIKDEPAQFTLQLNLPV
jgi:two-component system, LytTR family, sensor kinase